MSKEELVNLIRRFVGKEMPTEQQYGRPTIDEMIEQEPFRMLARFADFVREDSQSEG